MRHLVGRGERAIDDERLVRRKVAHRAQRVERGHHRSVDEGRQAHGEHVRLVVRRVLGRLGGDARDRREAERADVLVPHHRRVGLQEAGQPARDNGGARGPRRVEYERFLALAQREQAADVVELGVGEQHAAKARPRMRAQQLVPLHAEVGRAIEEQPLVGVVEPQRGRALRARLADPRARRVIPGVAPVPLRHAAARTRAEDAEDVRGRGRWRRRNERHATLPREAVLPQRVHHAPEHVLLEAEDGLGALERLGRAREVGRQCVQRGIDLVRQRGRALLEVDEGRGGQPRVALGPVLDALLVDVAREEVGHRRAHALLPGRVAAEVEVRVAGELGRRQQQLAVDDVGALEAERVGELQPLGQRAVDVVRDDVLAPHGTQARVGALGDDGRILARDGVLVVVSVGRPERQYLLGRTARLEELIEGMVDVVAVGQGEELVAKRGVFHVSFFDPAPRAKKNHEI